ncbi:MAG: metallophosphoesterase [Deltaproteobacteria bacterium]|nr:metallophosphoesterase [Deltaproteobacteria bacterium]
MSRITRPLVIALLLAAASFAVADQLPRGRTGQGVIRPENAKPVDETQLVLVAEPEVEVDGLKANIRFRTAAPAPAATVYFGTFEPDQQWTIPRYRRAAKEIRADMGTEHVVELKLGSLMAPEVDLVGAAKAGGAVVPYRIEVYDAKSARTVFFDRVFAFQDGKRAPTIAEGPFVDLVDASSAVISWETDLPTRGEVIAAGKRFSAPGTSTHFEIPITGLKSGAQTPYRVRIESGDFAFESREFAFKTDDPSSGELVFASFGDSREGVGGGESQFGGTNYRTLARFFTAAAESGAEFIIHSGDLVNGYTTSSTDFAMQLAAFKRASGIVGHSVPVYEAMGNHEIVMDSFDVDGVGVVSFDKTGEDSSEAAFARAFVNPRNGPKADAPGAPTYDENVYTFDRGRCRFVVFNNNYWWSSHAETYGGNLEGYVMDDQFAWMVRVFNEAKNDSRIDHVFLVAQEAMYPNGGHVADAMWYHGGDPAKNDGVDRRYVVARRDEIWRAFVGTGKAAAAIFGDEHNYNRTWIGDELDPSYGGGAWQIISGGAGAPYYARETNVPWAKFVKTFSARENWALFRVKGSRVEIEVRSFAGELIDRAVLKD